MAVESPLSHPRRSIRVGSVLFLIGLIFLVITVVPFFFGVHNQPLWLNLGCMLAPLGFVVGIVGVVRQGRADQAKILADLAVD